MDFLDAKTDIGLVREKNEDVVLSLSHPKNKNVKLLVAADGMGGRKYGEVAANYVAISLESWFLKKDIKDLNDTENIEKAILSYIKRLNTNLIKKYGRDKLGTTLTLALVTKKNTLLVNIGDSRAYVYKNNQLIQETEDDSDVWMYYKFGRVKKDDLRFFANNSIINACIGICNELCEASTKVIPNDYEMILLLTDGVTDNITDRKITSLIRKTPKQELLESIIHEAVYVDQHFKIPAYLTRKYLANYVIPFPGRDNASGAIYIV